MRLGTFLPAFLLASLSGCSGISISNPGAVHDDAYSGTAHNVLVLNKVTSFTTEKESETLFYYINKDLNTCHVQSYEARFDHVSLDDDKKVHDMMVAHNIDHILLIYNSEIVLDEKNEIRQEKIKSKLFSAKTKKAVWASDFSLSEHGIYFNGIKLNKQKEVPENISKNIIENLKKYSLLPPCTQN